MTRCLILLSLVGLWVVMYSPAVQARLRPSFFRRKPPTGRSVVRSPLAKPSPAKAALAPTRSQVNGFLSANPAAQRTLNSARARTAAKALSSPAKTVACGCMQDTCDTVSDIALIIADPPTDAGDPCYVLDPTGGVPFSICTGETFMAPCTEVGTCGMGTCEDQGIVNIDITALCFRGFFFPGLFELISFTEQVPQGGCCCA